MTRTNTYSLTMSGALILTLAALNLLLAPHLQADILAALLAWQVDALGAIFGLLSAFLIASVALDYSRSARAWVFLYSAIVFGGLAWALFEKGLVAESALLSGVSLAFLVSNWLTSPRDWLVEAIQWVNLYVGIGLLLRPDLFLAAPQYALFQPDMVRYSFVVVMLSSSATSFLLSHNPALGVKRQGVFLGLPWVIWGFMLFMPLRLTSVIICFGISVALMVKDLLPWKKLTLRQGTRIGRRLFRLVFSAEGLSLALVLWLIRLVESHLATSAASLSSIRETAFVVFCLLTLIAVWVVATVNLSINGVVAALNRNPAPQSAQNPPNRLWGQVKKSLLEPYTDSKDLLSERVRQQEEYEKLLAQNLNNERRRMAQLNLLHQLNLELESVLDAPVSAQLTVNAIYNLLGGNLVAIFQMDNEQEDLVMMAASGALSATIPPAYRQNPNKGLIGRAARLRRTQLVSDTRLDPDFFQLENQTCLSEMTIPLLYHNQLRGVLVIDHPETNAFDDSDMRTMEAVAIQLVTSWERNDHDQRLTTLIDGGITLSTTIDTDGAIHEIAEIARQTLDARFVFVSLVVDKGSGYTRSAYAGYAPMLVNLLSGDPSGNTLIQTTQNSTGAFRLRDVRKHFSTTTTGSHDLRSLLAAPIRMRASNTGAILAFGKQGSTAFSESDEALVSLLANQAAAAIEASRLYTELIATSARIRQLFDLSSKVIESKRLIDAAEAIAQTAHEASKGLIAGIILMDPKTKEIEARVQVDANGTHPGVQHPMELVEQTLKRGQSIMVAESDETTRICLPMQTPRRQYGALWVEVSGKNMDNSRFMNNLNTLANQAAIALERSILLVETRKQADEIKSAYHELELTYDQTLAGFSALLDIRDQETEGHSQRVTRVSCALARRIGLAEPQVKILERGAMLHDIGKMGVSDAVLLKPGKLDETEIQIMRRHPTIGADAVQGIPFLQEATPVIRYHHERWDGEGYPMGLKGTTIPLMARIFSVVDVYDAITSNRPYRTPMSMPDAIAHIAAQSGTAFDPEVTAEFCKMAEDGTLAALI
jgi:putative nucleotidyltransferase with HDIG domain